MHSSSSLCPAEYTRVVPGLWASGASGLSLGLLAPGWIHGCLGLRYAFGHRRTWQRIQPFLFAVALLLPVLAGVGFVTMGRGLEAQRLLSPATSARRRHPSVGSAARRTGTCGPGVHRCPCRHRLLPRLAQCCGAQKAIGRMDRLPGSHSERSARLDGPRGEPQFRRSACSAVRRSSSLHDMPGADR